MKHTLFFHGLILEVTESTTSCRETGARTSTIDDVFIVGVDETIPAVKLARTCTDGEAFPDVDLEDPVWNTTWQDLTEEQEETVASLDERLKEFFEVTLDPQDGDDWVLDCILEDLS